MQHRADFKGYSYVCCATTLWYAQYKKVSQLYLADYLSRVPVIELRKEADELNNFQVFAMEVESLNPFEANKLSPERLAQRQTCTAQDPVLMTLMTAVITKRTKRASSHQRLLALSWRNLDTKWSTLQ